MIKQLIQAWARRRSFKQAVKQANHLRASNFRKHCVIFMNGEYKVYSKQKLKWLYTEGYFKAGVNMKQVLKLVVYTTK